MKNFLSIVFILVISVVIISVLDSTGVCAVNNEFNVGCKVSRNYNQEINNVAATKILFNVEVVDTDNMFDLSEPGRINIVADGVYSIHFNVEWTDAVITGYRWMAINKNGGSIGFTAYEEPGSGVISIMEMDHIVPMVEGDYIEAYVYQTTGVVREIRGNAIESPVLAVQRTGIGGESMELDIALPTGFYVMIFGLVLIFISFFIKSPLISLAVIACMVACILEPAFKDTYYQTGCVIMAVWAAITFFVRMFKIFSGGE